jgi:hypothetical protein
MTTTPELTVDEARLELSRLEARANELRRFLRQRTPAGLTRNQRLAAEAYVAAGNTPVAAARLGMRHHDFCQLLAVACTKFGVDRDGLTTVLGVVL